MHLRIDRRRVAVLFHRASAAVWALLLIPALLWWQQSIMFVIAASIYANVKSDIGAANAGDDRAVLDRLDRLETVAAANAAALAALLAAAAMERADHLDHPAEVRLYQALGDLREAVKPDSPGKPG
jgi:hypothetical protein